MISRTLASRSWGDDRRNPPLLLLPVRALAVLWLLAGPASAVEVLDQAFDPATPANKVEAAVDDAMWYTQTFTLDHTGTLKNLSAYLTREAGDTANLTFSILGTDAGGVPDDGQTHFTGTVPGANLPTSPPGTALFTLDVGGLSIAVNAGDTLALAVTREVEEDVIWYGESDDAYGNGGTFRRIKLGGGNWTAVPGTDLGFRASVDAAVAPAGTKGLMVTLEGWQTFDGSELGLKEWRGAGLGSPLPRNVPSVISPDGMTAVQVGLDGFEFLDLGTETQRHSPWLSTDSPTTLTPGVRPVITADSDTVIYTTSTHFESASLTSPARSSVPFIDSGSFALLQGTGPLVTPDGAFAVAVTPPGYQIWNRGSNTIACAPISGTSLSQPHNAGSTPLLTDNRQVVFPREGGWDVVDLLNALTRFVPFAGVGSRLPLTINVNASYSSALNKVAFPTESGVEILDLATLLSRFVPWPGPVVTPLTRGVELALSPDELTLAYPGANGFALLDLEIEIAQLLQYPREVRPRLETPDGLQPGTDVVFSPDGSRAAYPTPAGMLIIDLALESVDAHPYPREKLILNWAHGVDPVWSQDSRFCAFPRDADWALFLGDLNGVTSVPYRGFGPVGGLAADVDPVFDPSLGVFLLGFEDGLQELDPVLATSTLRPWQGNPSGVGATRGVPFVSRGASSFSTSHTNDFSYDPADPDDFQIPGARMNFTTGIGRTESTDLSTGIQMDINGLLPEGVQWRRERFVLSDTLPDATGFVDLGALEFAIDGTDPADFMITANQPERGNYLVRFVAGETTNRDARYILDAELDVVPEVKFFDEREVGVDSSTSLEGVYLDDIIIGFSERGEMIVAPPGTPTPDGNGSGDFSASGLGIVGGTAITGPWNADTDEYYALDVLDKFTGRAMGRVHHKPLAQPTHDLSLYEIDTGRLLFEGEDLDLASRRGSADPAQAPLGIFNTSSESVVETSYDFGLIEAGGEVGAQGDLDLALPRGESGNVTLTRVVNPNTDPKTFIVNIDYGAAGSLNQSATYNASWTETGPQFVYLFGGDLWVDPSTTPDAPRGLFTATDAGQSVRGTVTIINDSPQELPNALTDAEITGLSLQSTDGGTFTLSGDDPRTLAAGDSLTVSIDADVTAENFQTELVLTADPATDSARVPLAGNARQGPLQFSGDGVSQDGNTVTVDLGEILVPGESATPVSLVFDRPNRVAVVIAAPTIANNVIVADKPRAIVWNTGDGSEVGDVIDPQGGILIVNSNARQVGAFQGTTTLRHLTTTSDGMGGTINGSPEAPTMITFVGRGIPESTFNFKDPRFVDDDTVVLEFPVVAGNHYVGLVSDDGMNFEPLQFEDPPGSGNVRDFTEAPVTKPNFEIFVHGRRGKPTGVFKVEGHENLRAQSVVVNDGQDQRSRLCKLCVYFNLASNLPDLIAAGTIGNAVQIRSTADGFTLPLTTRDFTYEPARNKLAIDFENLPERLNPSFYDVVLDTNLVHLAHDPTSPLLDDDGVDDGSHVFSGRTEGIFELYGDHDGDGHVGMSDFLTLSDNFKLRSPEAEALKAFDSDENGRIEFPDFVQFAAGYQMSLPR